METMVKTHESPDKAFWKNQRVLITGHTGFKGAWLSHWLSLLGARVFGLSMSVLEGDSLYDRFESKPVENEIFVDIRDSEATARAIADINPTIVFHMAAQSLVRPSYHCPIETFDTNVMGTVHVLDALRGTDSCKAIVVVTSDKCYENRDWVWPYRENDPMGGHDPYSASKGATELVVSSYRRSFFAGARIALASARAGNVIGGGDWAADRLVPDCIRSFEAEEKVSIRSPNALRPWQHVLDPLSGYLTLAEKLVNTEANYADGWNFGPSADSAKPVRHLVERMIEFWGEGANWTIDDTANLHEAKLLTIDASKAFAELGWHSRLDIDTALEWTIDWQKRFNDGTSPLALCEKQITKYMELMN